MATKKSLFSKPKWAAKASSVAKDDQPIFQQNVYKDIVEAERRREEKRIARQVQREDEQRRKSESRDTEVDEDKQPVKRQRISAEPKALEEDDEFNARRSDSDSDRSSRSMRSRRSSEWSSTPPTRNKHNNQNDHRPTLRITPKKGKRIGDLLNDTFPKKQVHPSIPLDEDDDLAITDVQPRARVAQSKSGSEPKPSPPPEESDSDPEEDPYLKELKLQARAEARAKKGSCLSAQNTPTDATDGRPPPLNPQNGTRDTVTPTPAPPDPDDPVVHIRIISMIPNCTELFVSRLASQPLDQVLSYFTQHFNLGPQLSPRVFFTWNGTKLYKSTTMRSILAMIRTKYGRKKDADGKIEIEAMTEEIYQHRLQQKERARNGGYQDADEGAAQQNGEAPLAAAVAAANDLAQPQPQRGAGTVIHLKSENEQELPPMSLRVHPHTTIERIVRGYKKKMALDMNRKIYLVFDGDVLETEQTVADIGFEEGDSVDVRAR